MINLNSLFQNLNKHLDIDVIEEFRELLRKTLDRNLMNLEKRYENLAEDDVLYPQDLPDYRNHLEDQMYFNGEVRKLGAELCIMSLYRQVELHINKVLTIYNPDVNPRKLSKADEVIKAFPWISDLEHYGAYTELRMLNNHMKHVANIGSIDSDSSSDLDQTYKRLSYEVKLFITTFVKAASETSHRFDE